MSTKQLKAYGNEANGLGLRATGAPNTEKYIAKLASACGGPASGTCASSRCR